MFDFRQITLFSFGYRLSGTTCVYVPKIWGCHGTLGLPGYAYDRTRTFGSERDLPHCKNTVCVARTQRD